MNPSTSRLVIIPAFNPGPLLAGTVEAACGRWDPVWVVVDGSTDRSHDALRTAAGAGSPRVMIRPDNGGKGAAVLTGARAALDAGFSHALVMDADGQHPADRIGAFMEASHLHPDAVICGRPVFGPEAPKVRLYGRQLSVGLVHLETSGRGAADPLFGFRVYPLGPLVRVLEDTRGGRRYDFDPEVAVRLAWLGVPAVNLEAECRYIGREAGGVSHFRYFWDNVRMVKMHIRLLAALLFGRRRVRSA